jgi:uncharacterized protein
MEIDRLSPALRHSCGRRPTGRQTWKDLLFLHWEVPPEALRALVPPALVLDTFDGRAYVGLVPFTMHDVRIGPLPVRDFLEVNVRTYVHAGGVPGVWFFSLDAQSRLAVWGARTFFRLPYHRARMRSETRGASTSYSSAREGPGGPAALEVRWAALDAEPHAAEPGTLDHFLTERYALYGPLRGGGAYRVRVHHRAWPLRRARLDGLSSTLLRAARLDAGDPIPLVLASPEGVAVETFAKEPVAIPRARNQR